MTKSDFSPGEYAIEREDSGILHASDGIRSLSVVPVNGEEIWCRHRNSITKDMGTGETTSRRILVTELDGVKLYMDGDNLVLTKQDLYFS